MSQVTQQTDWRALTEQGAALLREGQPEQALEVLQLASRAAPLERDVRYWLANACRMAGQTDRSAGIFRQLLDERPGDFEASFALAFLLRDTGAAGDAAEVLRNAARQPGVTTHQLLQVAGFLRNANQIAAAIEVCERVAAMHPGQADLHFKLARLYQAAGDFGRSQAALLRTLDLEPSTGPAWVALAQQKKFVSAEDEEFRRLRAAAGQSYGRETDMCVAFALGKALDDLARWPEAWAWYRKGNRLMSGAHAWNSRAWADFLSRALARNVAAPSSVPGNARNAVFIVGMLRSGTTLLEQMLDRHPEIHGRGELNFLRHFAEQRSTSSAPGPEQRAGMADTLWTQMRLDGPETAVYIDKNPLNFRYLDFLFELLPTARVLHLTRDGRASCLSCFFQLFAEHADTAFAYELDDLVVFYSGYRRLMAHWEQSWPQRIWRVDYNDLVHSPRDTLAGVLDFLGREWNDSVMQIGAQQGIVRTASVWQARQPLHTRSVERWRRYYELARDFFDRLAAIDDEYR